MDDFCDGAYEPDDEEIAELNEILKQEEQQKKHKPTNRLIHIFHTQSHFTGWLRVNGMRW